MEAWGIIGARDDAANKVAFALRWRPPSRSPPPRVSSGRKVVEASRRYRVVGTAENGVFTPAASWDVGDVERFSGFWEFWLGVTRILEIFAILENPRRASKILAILENPRTSKIPSAGSPGTRQKISGNSATDGKLREAAF